MSNIILERSARRAIITINQPQRKNAMSQAMWQMLAEILSEIADDQDVRVVVFRGAETAFCAGADISEFDTVYQTADSARAANQEIAKALNSIDTLPMPSIAAIQGPCMGGGCALAIATDLQLADCSATFGINPTALGTAYSFRDCQRLVARIGLQRAKQMLMGARRLDAQSALSWGLISEVIETELFEDRLEGLAAEMAQRSPDALRRVKSMLGAIDRGTTANNESLQQLFEDSFSSADFNEGTSAFLAKRTPSF